MEIPKYYFIVFCLLSLIGCVVESTECNQDLSGTYEGIQSSLSFTGSGLKSVTLIITGEEGDYEVTSPTGTALQLDALEQDGCGFQFSVGSFGSQRTGEVTIEGDSIWYETSGNSFGTLPTTFWGVRTE